MTRFPNPYFINLVEIQEHTPSGKWVLVEPLSVEWGRGGNKSQLTAPEGFVTDGPSVPRVFRTLVPKSGPKFAPSVIHDYAIRHKKLRRSDADLLFLKLLAVKGVSFWQAGLMYLAVSSWTLLVAGRFR